MMSVKPGVDIEGVTNECVLGILVAHCVFESLSFPFVVTSLTDGQHMEKSLHYAGRAFDCRLPSRYVLTESEGLKKSTNERVLAALKKALGTQWDVVLESDHFHIEFDPK